MLDIGYSILCDGLRMSGISYWLFCYDHFVFCISYGVLCIVYDVVDDAGDCILSIW